MRPASLLPPAGGARRLAVATLVNSVGNGVFATIGTIYFLRFADLTVSQVGSGLAVAAGVAMVVGLPLGRLADRVGVRAVFLALLLVSAGAVAAYVGVRSWPPFLVVAVVAVTAERSTAGVRNAFIAQVVGGRDRVRTRAYLRSVTNVGAAVGAGIGGTALASDVRGLFDALLVVDAATFVGAAVVVSTIPAASPAASPGGAGLRTVLTDARFLRMSCAQAFLSLHGAVLTVTLPLWIATRTEAPTVTVAVLTTGTMVGAVALQVWVSARTDRPGGSARAARQAGVALAAACLVLGPSGSTGPVAAVVLLMLGGALRLAGELLQSASGWAMSFNASPPGMAASYQALYSTAFSGAAIAGPLISTAIVLAYGWSGWAVLAVAFLVAGAVASRAAPATEA
ncbi:MFS transporter [uncultured Friedmanniella sp.]|uniref:MFS transporter n=1 Tax=uncultured Friedmanniella sp. TaxID=335381 RepID=UPI0035CA8D76